MTTVTLLADVERRGIVLSADGDLLIVDAPIGALTESLRTALKLHKPALIAALSTTGVEPEIPTAIAPSVFLVPSHTPKDWVAPVGRLLIDAVEAGKIDESEYWEIAATFDERSAICEFCGNLSRADAEHAAYLEVAAELEVQE